MKLTRLIALAGVMALGTGCATSTKTATKSQTPAPQEPIVVVQTPESGMLPGASAWEWTPPEHNAQSTTEAQMQPTSLGAQKSSMGHHLKKRAPKKQEP